MSGRYRQPPPPPKTLPDWVRDIQGTITRIESADYPHFARPQIEAALGVCSTVAKKILRRMGATKEIGNALLIPKPALLRELRKIAQNPGYSALTDREITRQARIEALRPNRGGHAKLSVTAPQRATLEQTTVATLPDGVSIYQGTVTLHVAGWNDYLTKLAALIHATDNDRDTIEKAIT